ncbi:hypothetical protein NQ315_010547 [Exocentrus adspersus]|uniref:FHA domain-containing protein n=1 Tax=Exocentrus adspersus TaxID=1586481 RepID=A0AAV8W4N6_9CUCU|nr:hypothetical protein NQ315_010547 [Exocentrus adspersus]
MEPVENNLNVASGDVKAEEIFKKPVLIGKVGCLPRKIQCQGNPKPECNNRESNSVENFQSTSISGAAECSDSKKDDSEAKILVTQSNKQSLDNSVPLSYKEPSWGGLPQSNGKAYAFEVLKNGTIIETVNLMERSFWVFGRLPSCNICMQHPTISRYHAVLQYRSESTETESCGFYIYDLGSTHGTYLNKNRLKPRVYARVQVGHMLKLGCSTRTYILSGPEDDTEAESEFTVTELKQKRAEELLKREEELKEAERYNEEMARREEEKGIDWGLGDDADEETDLSENPYAQTTNEELYLDDPKKALRGFFEREGFDLNYVCNEQGLGQFLCRVDIPLYDEAGQPIIVEVLHKGKKKEAIVQCALEACRILDRLGVLRQATHESRKRKAKNWEENDFYDSDEDTFLDRTGTIEKKREMRMKAKIPEKAETYESLLEKEKSLLSTISDLEKQIAKAEEKNNHANSGNVEEDSLESYMKELENDNDKSDKYTLRKLKLDLVKLKEEHTRVVRLANIAKPASLPELIPQSHPSTSTSKNGKSAVFPIIGKRRKTKLQLPTKAVPDDLISNMNVDEDDDEEEEEISNNEEVREKVETSNIKDHTAVSQKDVLETVQKQPCVNSSDSSIDPETSQTSEQQNNRNTSVGSEEVSSGSSANSSDEDLENLTDVSTIRCFHNTMTFKKFEKMLKKGLPPLADKHQEKLEKILNNVKKLAANEDRLHVDWKMLAAKKAQDLKHCESNEKLEHKVSSELNRLLAELNTMTGKKYKIIDQVKKMGKEIKNISDAIDKDFKAYKEEISKSHGPEVEASTSSAGSRNSDNETVDNDNLSMEDTESTDSAEAVERRKKKNQRRICVRQEKAELERQRGYEEDESREDYNMWIPPSNQTGDGRTSLNDKLGY